MTAVKLATTRWPSIPPDCVVLVPVGSLEQHGPHLPLATDAVIAEGVTTAVADLLEDPVFVAPGIVYGSSGEHQTFPGTSSIGADALRVLLVELVRSMRTWATRVIFVNAHGGNVAPLAGAVSLLVAEGHDVAWVACATESFDLHAGRTETSLMLHLAPDHVRLDLAEPGSNASLDEALPILRERGIAAVSSNGVLGNPEGATADEGRRCLSRMAAEIAVLVGVGSVDSKGELRQPSVAAL